MKKALKKAAVIFGVYFLIVGAAVLTDSQQGKYIKAVSSDFEGTVSARQAVLIDGESGSLLYSKNGDDKAYPASTTKILTVLIAIETMEALDSSLDQKVATPPEVAGKEGSSIYLAAGEKVSVRDLLYGAMLRSGNDAATALAVIIGGSEEHFVKMMNRRARELGCNNSNFLNPTGLFDENHYTTAADMALIGAAAMDNETFRKIAGTENYMAHRAPDKYNSYYNKNKTLYEYEGGSGVKIGYTEASGRTLVASASRGGREMICVVMCAPDWFNDAYRLMDYGFDKTGN